MHLPCAFGAAAVQLPPTVISEQAARAGLSRTLFERLQVRCWQGLKVAASCNAYGMSLRISRARLTKSLVVVGVLAGWPLQAALMLC